MQSAWIPTEPEEGTNTDWLQNLRIQKGFSQEDVANKIGISRSAYSNIENGNRRPSPDVAMAIANLLGFPWTFFFEHK